MVHTLSSIATSGQSSCSRLLQPNGLPLCQVPDPDPGLIIIMAGWQESGKANRGNL